MARPSVAAAVLAAAVASGTTSPVLAVEPGFRLHADEFPLTPRVRLILGVNAGEVEISELTSSPSYADGAELLAGDYWDFSGVDGAGRVLQTVPVAPEWTCYVPEPGSVPDGPCGFDRPENDFLFAQDALDTGGRDILAIDFDGVSTYYLRAWAIDEGGTPSTGDEELRLCLWPNGDRKEVPFMVFGKDDGSGRRYVGGDPPYGSWQSAVFECSRSGSPIGATDGAPCGTAGGLSAVLNDGNETLGRFTGRVVRPGTLVLPSGHVLDAVLVEILASFRAVLNPFCIDTGRRTRQYQLMWLVPGHGPLVQVRSPDDQGPDLTTWTTTSSTVIGSGLLPPLSVGATATGATTVEVTWDPGLRTSGITGYRVHWSTEQGQAGAAASSSPVLDAAARSHVVSGLTPETTYWFSVSTVATYEDPRARTAAGDPIVTEYHSISLPETIGADVDGDGVRDTQYPPEASATTSAASGTDWLALNETSLETGRPEPPLADLFDPSCRTPPPATLELCPARRVDGALDGLVARGEAAPSGRAELRLLEHSLATDAMVVRRQGDDLVLSSR